MARAERAAGRLESLLPVLPEQRKQAADPGGAPELRPDAYSRPTIARLIAGRWLEVSIGMAAAVFAVGVVFVLFFYGR